MSEMFQNEVEMFVYKGSQKIRFHIDDPVYANDAVTRHAILDFFNLFVRVTYNVWRLLITVRDDIL